MRSKPTVTVTINKVRWKQVPSFVGSGPDDRHFVVETAGDKTVIQFGDGIQGAAPRPGSTIEAGYRTGHGAAGNNVAIILGIAARRTTGLIRWVAHPQSDEDHVEAPSQGLMIFGDESGRK